MLDSDLVLEETLELRSFTTLNCRGHRLTPSRAGFGDSVSTYVPSSPAAAIVVTGERRVAIKNCAIGDEAARFDFGIIAISSKNVGRDGHVMRNNEVHARDAGITLLRVDDAEITDNEIFWTTGVGIAVRRDSDRNHIANNALSSPGTPAMPARIVPDGPFAREADQGIAIVPGPTQPLFNLVVSGRLHQFPNLDGSYPTTDDNVIEGNSLSLPGTSVGKEHSAIMIAGTSSRTRVLGNTITQAGVGIRIAGLSPTLVVSRPSRCVGVAGPTGRLCATDADCFVSGVDVEPLGTCPELAQDVTDARGRETFVEGNTLAGPFNSTNAQLRAGISGGNGTIDGIIRGNFIGGTGNEAGISLAGNMLESGEVTDNVVVGGQVALLLSQGPATFFGARVSRNDFVGATVRGVGVLGAYGLPTELSWDGAGNHWGHAAPPCFAPEDSPDLTLIRDSNAYCAPTAGAE